VNQQRTFGQDVETILAGIEEGMPVYDLNNERLGIIKHVQFPNDSADEGILVDDAYLQNTIGPLRMRLLKSGYIKIDTGWLRRDLYAMVDQIEQVAPDGVYLYVLRDRLTRL
jgi:hypothetical protein